MLEMFTETPSAQTDDVMKGCSLSQLYLWSEGRGGKNLNHLVWHQVSAKYVYICSRPCFLV